MLLSVVMPAHNVASVIRRCVEGVSLVASRLCRDYEIVVVDDGSTDGTYLVAKRLEHVLNPHLRVYRLPKNMGKGFALIYGFRKSRGDIIAFFDSDLDIDPLQLYVLVRVLEASGADAVITSKWHPRSKVEATALRKLLSHSFRGLVRAFLGLRLSDTQTGAKVFKRRVLEDVVPLLRVRRYAFDAELLAYVQRLGYRIVEVPALRSVKLGSCIRPVEIARMLLDLLAVAYRLRLSPTSSYSAQSDSGKGS